MPSQIHPSVERKGKSGTGINQVTPGAERGWGWSLVFSSDESLLENAWDPACPGIPEGFGACSELQCLMA